MSQFAVAYVNFFDNDLIIECVMAADWREALLSHSALQVGADDPNYKKWLDALPQNLEEAKEYFFDADTLVDVVEIPVSA